MTKKKAKILLLILLLAVGLVAGFYFSGFMNLAFMQNFQDPSQLKISAIVKSLSTNKNHFTLFICTEVIIACMVSIVVLLNRRESYESDIRKVTETIDTPIKVGQGQHGSAKWLPREHYPKAFATAEIFSGKAQLKSGGLVVGYEKTAKGEKVYYLDEDVHSCVIGATRSGKTRCIVLQSIALTALSGESMVISDTKGELFSYTAPFLESLGYEVIALDFKNPLKSSKYNFLQPVIDAVKKGDNARAVDLTWDITASLVGEAQGEKIWTNGEASIIAGAIMSVVFDNKDKPEFQNFTNVYHFILNMCRTEGNEMPINKYMREIPDTHPAKGLFGIAQVAPSRTRGSFFTSALTTLRLFTNENIYTQTCKSDFVLQDTGNRKRAIFIILPDEKTTFYSLASLFVYQHYVALVDNADSRGGRLQTRVEFFLDEYGNFTQIPAFANMLTVGGGRGIRFHIFLQSFAQIDEKYGREAAETIKDNCYAWIYLKTSNNPTAEIISKKLGQYTTSSYSKSSSYNSGGSYNANISASMNLIARPLLTEDEIMRIERPYVLVMYAGFYPAIMKLPDLSRWAFNEILGMGDKEHNRLLREERERNRPDRKVDEIKLWGIWHSYASTPPKRRNRGETDGREAITEYERAERMRRVNEKNYEEDDD